MRPILITGAGGFTAPHLHRHLSQLHPEVPIHRVFGAGGRGGGGDPLVHDCDLRDRERVHALLDALRPGDIFHLAGTFTNHFETDVACNVTAAAHVLEWAAGDGAGQPRVLVLGSAAEYGEAAEPGAAVPEHAPARPISVYGFTKACQTRAAEFFARARGVHVVVARPFNLLGPGAPRALFLGNLLAQLRELDRCERDEIRLGNLSGRRDFVDVRDAVVAYALILARGRPGEVYNVGAGRLTALRDLLAALLEAFALVADRVVVDAPEHWRPEAPGLSFSADLARTAALGWPGARDLGETVSWIRDAHRASRTQ